MSRGCTSWLSVLLLSFPILGCASRPVQPTYRAIPVESLLHSFKGEQWDILFQYGMPDRAFQGPLGITRWIYCHDKSGGMITIEFDIKGGILLEQFGEDPDQCPAKDKTQHIEQWSRTDEGGQRRLVAAIRDYRNRVRCPALRRHARPSHGRSPNRRPFDE